jgi:hypothetical protein
VAALVTVAGEDAADMLRDLYHWLSEEPELRGLVRIREADIPAGALGTGPLALEVLLGAGGAAATAAGMLIAWLNSRRGEFSVKVTQSDGKSAEISAKGTCKKGWWSCCWRT